MAFLQIDIISSGWRWWRCGGEFMTDTDGRQVKWTLCARRGHLQSTDYDTRGYDKISHGYGHILHWSSWMGYLLIYHYGHGLPYPDKQKLSEEIFILEKELFV